MPAKKQRPVGRPRGRPDLIPVKVYLPPSVRDALHERARAEQRTVTATFERAMLAYLDTEVDE